MNKKLFVGNIAFGTAPETIRELFSSVGTVEEVIPINDQQTGRPRGFVFVTMSTAEEAAQALERFHGYEVDGRALMVSEARPRVEKASNFESHRREPNAEEPRKFYPPSGFGTSGGHFSGSNRGYAGHSRRPGYGERSERGSEDSRGQRPFGNQPPRNQRSNED
jgi:cold-inducible RNA-binding protein